jgi:hypothetical protein
MTQDIACIAEKMGLLHEFQHIDYADPTQDPIGVYGEGNVEYLREATREYRPKVFGKSEFLEGLSWD